MQCRAEAPARARRGAAHSGRCKHVEPIGQDTVGDRRGAGSGGPPL